MWKNEPNINYQLLWIIHGITAWPHFLTWKGSALPPLTLWACVLASAVILICFIWSIIAGLHFHPPRSVAIMLHTFTAPVMMLIFYSLLTLFLLSQYMVSAWIVLQEDVSMVVALTQAGWQLKCCNGLSHPWIWLRRNFLSSYCNLVFTFRVPHDVLLWSLWGELGQGCRIYLLSSFSFILSFRRCCCSDLALHYLCGSYILIWTVCFCRST